MPCDTIKKVRDYKDYNCYNQIKRNVISDKVNRILVWKNH